MRTLSKLLITRYEGRVLTARIQNGKVIQMDLEPSEASGRLGNIYIGKVKNIVKNINAAFVDLGGGQMGYYSLSDNESHLFTQPGRTGALREGDEILVQVSRDAVKTKAPVLTSNLNFPGRYSVLTVGKTAAGVSAKIKDAGERPAAEGNRRAMVRGFLRRHSPHQRGRRSGGGAGGGAFPPEKTHGADA